MSGQPTVNAKIKSAMASPKHKSRNTRKKVSKLSLILFTPNRVMNFSCSSLPRALYLFPSLHVGICERKN